jgi:hypothetical protein
LYGYIYKTTDLHNNKIYIGQRSGKFDPSYYGSGIIIRNILVKIKKNNTNLKDRLKLEILSLCESKEELDYEEQRLIKEYSSQDPKLGYNRTPGGSGRKTKLSKETKEKIRKANMGKHLSDETKRKLRIAMTEDKNPMFGKRGKEHPLFNLTGGKNPRQNFHHSEETRNKIRESMNDRSGERNSFYGRKHSIETKNKMSKSKSGENSPRAIRLKAVNRITNQELTFLSLKEAGIYFNVTDGRIFKTRAINLSKNKSLDIRATIATDWNFYLEENLIPTDNRVLLQSSAREQHFHHQ